MIPKVRRQAISNLLLFPIPSGPPDADARADALDIRRSFIVEAPAGSGKTALLIQRLLKLLADDSVASPEQVLAMTFTVKATGELRDRVLAQLDAAASGTPTLTDFEHETRILAEAVLERDRLLEWSLRDHPHRLNIRTIGSVCAEIAGRLPILSGSGGRLEPTTDPEPLHREAARRTLLLLGSGDPVFDHALRHLLLHRDGNLAEVELLLAAMLNLRDQWGELVPLSHTTLDDAWLDANVLPRLQRTLERIVCTALTRLTRAIPAHTLAALSLLAAEMACTDGYRGQPSPIAICGNKDRSPAANAEDLDHWRALIHLLVKPSKPRGWRRSVAANSLRFHIAKHHQLQLKAIIAEISQNDGLMDALCQIDALPPAVYPPEQWAVAKSLFRVLSRALVELQLVFSEHGQCDFTEPALLARTALKAEDGPEDLASALGARLQHLLVDEMQDTSTSQYELIQLLTQSWDGHGQTVFLVGDPKQSIYLFRQAHVERFVQTMRSGLLGDLPLTPLRLTANFRSQRALVEQFNLDFPLLFPSAATSASDIPYTPADAVRNASPHTEAIRWHAHPIPAPAAGAVPAAAELRQRQHTQDAATIRSIVLDWLARPLPPGRRILANGRPEPWRIAVLVRNRTHLTEIVAAFSEAATAIPFRAVEIDSLADRQEVLDLAALTRALLHPADRVATLAVLRAPWCGLSLADLHTLTGADPDHPTLKHHAIQRLIDDRGDLLSEESIVRLQRVWRVLHDAAEQRARLTLSQLVERAWRSLGGDAWLTPPQLANARRFLQLLDQLEAQGGPIDAEQLGRHLHKLFAEPAHYAEDTAFVDLMTIHKAKGLEWDVVFVLALEGQPGGDRNRLLTWAEVDGDDTASSSLMLAPIAGKGKPSQALNQWLKGLHRAREAAERKRLFYVAATRAREELHLFAAPVARASGGFTIRYDSLLDAARPIAQPHLAAATALGGPGLDQENWENAAPAPEPIPFPAPSIGLDLAASTDAPFPRPILHRIPLTFDPATRLQATPLPYGDLSDTTNPTRTIFSRPEGSFAARAFGTAVHVFLELIAERIADHTPAAEIFTALPAWSPRIAAHLRGHGLPPVTVDRLARETLAALDATLRNTDGLWLLARHEAANYELELTARNPADRRPMTIRIDRNFRAGASPHAPGEDHLWIIDYKTTAPGPTGLTAFLDNQRTTYAPQLETYARTLAPHYSIPPDRIRLALYFPTIPHLLWWTIEERAT